MNKFDKMLRMELNFSLSRELNDFLIKNNFKKKGPNCYFKTNSIFIEVIWVQLGQWNGGSFYLHYSKEMLCNIFRSDILYGGLLSKRIDRGSDGVSWIAKSKVEVPICIKSLIHEIEITVFPFFQQIINLDKFILECISLPNKSCNDILLAVAFASIKKFDKSWWICEDYKENINTKEIDKIEKLEIISNISKLQNSIDENIVNELLSEWKKAIKMSLL